MSFVDGFYSFNIDLVDTNRHVYQRLRTKLAKHPHEDFEHLYARLIAFMHSYEPGLKFTQGLFEPTEPTLWMLNGSGEILRWIEVGCPEKKRARKLFLLPKETAIRTYLYTAEQIESLCRRIRGSDVQELPRLEGYRLDITLLEALAGRTKSKMSGRAMFVEQQLYLTLEDMEYASTITPLDMNNLYPRVLAGEDLLT